jgi:type III pantothenate kinase
MELRSSVPAHKERDLIAVDVGNSRLKIGRFEPLAATHAGLPEPLDSFDSPITDRDGQFDADRLRAWCVEHVSNESTWLVASVHRGAAARLAAEVITWSNRSQSAWTLRQLSYQDVPLAIHVDEPQRVGIDRLLGAFAANRLRHAERGAIVVDLGTAITVDLVDPQGSFAGGAILPGLALSAQALAEHTDALPAVTLDCSKQIPAVLGKSTVNAIQAGLFWGAVGAIRELASNLAAGLPVPPDVYLTGGAAPQVAEVLSASTSWSIRHVPHLVLAGIALANDAPPAQIGA